MAVNAPVWARLQEVCLEICAFLYTSLWHIRRVSYDEFLLLLVVISQIPSHPTRQGFVTKRKAKVEPGTRTATCCAPIHKDWGNVAALTKISSNQNAWLELTGVPLVYKCVNLLFGF